MRMCITLCLALLTLSCVAQEEQLEPVDIRFMLRGYFYAGSAIEDAQALGGFGSSQNLPRPAPDALLEAGVLRLVALPDEPRAFCEKYQGYRVLLVNGSDEVQAFEASDSRLSIIQEARHSDGTWKPIEYLPSSWCGNSYHRVFLGPRECWVFSAPALQGELETELRFRLQRDAGDIVSEPFPGRINPEQFEVKRPYTPQGLMDSYND